MSAAVPLANLFSSEDWLTLLGVSLTGIHLARPVYAAEGTEIVDFVIEYVNPAGQRMTGLEEQPNDTLLNRFPHAVAAGIFQYYRRVFETGELAPYQTNYQADGLDNYFHIVARRSGERLVVSFTDTADQDRSGVENALRESQTAEHAARAEAEAERQRLYRVLMRMPANIALLRGPEHVYDLVNAEYERLFPARTTLGRTIREVIPELDGQGFYELFDRVYETGEPFYQAEAEAWADYAGTGELQRRYYRTSFEPIRNAEGAVTEVLNFAVDVTAQVEARQQVEQLNQQTQAARAEVERERAQLQALLAQAPVAIGLLTGDDLHVAAANAEMAAIWGYLPAQVVGRPLLEGVPELRGQGFDDLLRQVLHTQVPVTGQEAPAQMLRDGQLQTSYYNFVYQPLYAASGQVLGVLDVAVDVTEQVLARQQLEQLNQELEARVQQRTHEAQQAQLLAERERNLLQAVLTQAPVAIGFFQGEDLRITSANAQLATMWGRTAEQVVGQPFMDAVPELRGQGFEEQMRQVFSTQVPVRGTETPATMLRNGQLQTTYYDFVYQPLYDPEGQLLGVIDVAVEVTEQVLARRQVEQLNQELEARVQERTQQAEAARAEAEIQRQRFYDLLMQLPAHVAVHEGPDQIFTLANPGYLRQTPGMDLIGKPIRQVWPELVDHGILDVLDRVYQTGEPFIATELPVQADFTRTGKLEQVYYNFFFLALHDAQGQINGVLNFSYDVTPSVVARQQVERLNAELETRVQARTEELATVNQELTTTNGELSDSNRQLTRSNVDLDTFVYTASHDLKAPITNIEGILHALRDTLPTEVQQDELVAHLLGLLDDTVGRFLTTIHQLTDLSRLQQTYNEPAELLPLAPIVADVLTDLASAITAATAQLHVTVPADLRVSFAPSSLRSVVYNLLSNAVKYRDPERPAQVWLTAEQQAGAVVLTVRDNGLGLTETQQTRLFGVFQRLHTHVEGTGVGLYMIKRLIENAGATITVTSTPGVGSTFTVAFPIPIK